MSHVVSTIDGCTFAALGAVLASTIICAAGPIQAAPVLVPVLRCLAPLQAVHATPNLHTPAALQRLAGSLHHPVPQLWALPQLGQCCVSRDRSRLHFADGRVLVSGMVAMGQATGAWDSCATSGDRGPVVAARLPVELSSKVSVVLALKSPERLGCCQHWCSGTVRTEEVLCIPAVGRACTCICAHRRIACGPAYAPRQVQVLAQMLGRGCPQGLPRDCHAERRRFCFLFFWRSCNPLRSAAALRRSVLAVDRILWRQSSREDHPSNGAYAARRTRQSCSSRITCDSSRGAEGSLQ